MSLLFLALIFWPGSALGKDPIVTRYIPNSVGPMTVIQEADITLAETPEEFTAALNFQANEIARRNTELSRSGQDEFGTGRFMGQYREFKAVAEGKIGQTKPANWTDEQWQNYQQALGKYNEAENVYRENVNLNQSNQQTIQRLEGELAKDPNNQDLKDALAEAKKNASASTVKGKCGWFDWLCMVEEVVGYWLTSIQFILFGPFLWLAAFFFNLALNLSVNNLDQFLQISGVIQAWSVVRDLCNLVFIFALLYGAINIVIGKGGAGAKSLVSSIIIAALLVNFSGFFVRSLVDISNLVATAFNDQISQTTSNGDTSTTGKTTGLASSLLKAVQLTSVEEPVPGYPGITQMKRTSLPAMLVSFGFSIIFALVFICILFYLAFVFMLRAVAIIVIFIMSPLAIASFFLPLIGKSTWDKWWGHFKDNLLFAPLLLFNLYWILLVLNSGVASVVGKIGIPNTASSMGLDLFSGTLDAMVFYIIAIFLLITGISTAKSSAGSIGAMAGKAAEAVGGAILAGGAAAGALAGKKIGVTKRLSSWYSGSGGRIARTARAVGRTGVGKKLASPISSALGALEKHGVPGASSASYENWSKYFGGENKELDDQLARRYNGDEEEGRKGEHKFKAFQKMSSSDQARLYSKLSAEDRAKLENEAKKARLGGAGAPISEVETNIATMRSKLKGKESEAVKKSLRTEVKQDKQKGEKKNALDTLNASITSTTPTQREDAIRNVSSGQSMVELFEENEASFRARPDMLQYLTATHLSSLASSGNLDATTKTAIKTAIARAIIAGAADPMTSGARTWLLSHPEF